MPDWDIVGMEFDPHQQVMHLRVSSEKLAAGYDGEIVGYFGSHETGTFSKWKPREEPAPPMFMRIMGTDTCFWCRRDLNEHGPDRVCPKEKK